MTLFLRHPAWFAEIMLLLVLLLSGCYTDRMTGNYGAIPDLEDGNNAVLDKSEFTEEDRQKQFEDLKKVAAAPLPPYTISGGDKLAIVVYNHQDLSIKTVVTPDGYIGMVLVGQLKVEGLSLAEASAKLEKALSRYIRNPRVGISPYEIVSETVTISGAVVKPGLYPISGGMRISDLFAAAGGAASLFFDGQTISATDYDNSIFVRNGKIIPLDFVKAIMRADPVHNLPLRRGDYIFIAERASSMVYLIGEVEKPKQKVWTPQLGLLELITNCEGLKETHWSHAIIIRGGLAKSKMYKVDLDGILCGAVQNVPLKAGDIVYIPKDNISEYNVFIRKLLPTAQLINMILTPATWMSTHM